MEETVVNAIYGDVDVCSKEEAERMRALKGLESEILSEYTIDINKNFTSWW